MNTTKNTIKENLLDRLLGRTLVESMITIYHGDDFGTTAINPKLMNNGNNEEGIGIYFSNNLSTAKHYGKDVVSCEVDESKLIDSRAMVAKLGKAKVKKVLMAMMKADLETFFYLASDYVEVVEPEDVEEWHIDPIYANMSDMQVRHFQIMLANQFGVETFVDAWNTHIKLDGTFHEQRDGEVWYAITNPKIKLSKVM